MQRVQWLRECARVRAIEEKCQRQCQRPNCTRLVKNTRDRFCGNACYMKDYRARKKRKPPELCHHCGEKIRKRGRPRKSSH